MELAAPIAISPPGATVGRARSSHPGVRAARAAVACIGVAAALALAPAARAAGLDAPNVVPVDARLVTAGQPTAAALASLRAQGFEAVIYLAPPTVADAVRDEPDILQRQGIAYVNVPIDFASPGERDFDAVSDAVAAALAAHRGAKVLVHCQVNMRASVMVFLYRVVVGREDPEAAYRDVARVWSPRGPWRRLIVDVLRRHGVSFEPY
jgi:protein tyrosine phosphatase (PTP) superfamily phosphohydrolase (DUF442 family)